MPHHDVVHKMARTIRGMKLEFKCEAPVAADVEPITDKVEQLFSWAAKDPNQFGLQLDPKED